MFYEPIEIKDSVKRVFISFGGADPQNYSDRILNMIIKPEYKNYHFIVVLVIILHHSVLYGGR